MPKIFSAAVLAAVMVCAGAAQAQYLIVGNDEKAVYDDAGKLKLSLPGKDTVTIINIRDPAHPKIVANLPLENSIVGPPTNLAVTPDNKLALVANSLDVVKDGDSLKNVPDTTLFVIDLTVSPPVVLTKIQLGKQPSGLAINRAGTLALVANRADNTVSVLTISGKSVSLVGNVAVAPAGAPSQQVSAIAITPDGKHALAAKAGADKVALLDIDGTNVTYKGYDMITGVFPYNVQITPDGKFGLVNNNGATGSADGQADTVAVIDMTLDPPRVVDQVTVGDAPEGLAVSPKSDVAVTVLTNGAGNVPPGVFFHHDHSVAVVLKVEGKSVRKVSEIDVGRLAEGVAFSPDGRYAYVANDLDSDLTVLRLAGGKLVRVGSLKLPGHAASLRGSTP
ncbi:MAG TPA: YncE family protein [Stellaceae bacterium]|nr:YncE family protein [Stellaceae bacterium]